MRDQSERFTIESCINLYKCIIRKIIVKDAGVSNSFSVSIRGDYVGEIVGFGSLCYIICDYDDSFIVNNGLKEKELAVLVKTPTNE